MTDTFRQLCAEVHEATVYEASYEKCCPHYQRVLDYIVAHPEERDDIASLLGLVVRCQSGMADSEAEWKCQIYLVQFLMQTLKWPEIKAVAEEGYHKGDGMGWIEVKHLLEIY